MDPVIKAGIPWKADYMEINVNSMGGGSCKVYGFSSLGRGQTNWPANVQVLPSVK